MIHFNLSTPPAFLILRVALTPLLPNMSSAAQFVVAPVAPRGAQFLVGVRVALGPVAPRAAPFLVGVWVALGPVAARAALFLVGGPWLRAA